MGAEPGIFMPADPHVGDAFRQEFLPGQAEDHFEITNLDATIDGALRDLVPTPCEPRNGLHSSQACATPSSMSAASVRSRRRR